MGLTVSEKVVFFEFILLSTSNSDVGRAYESVQMVIIQFSFLKENTNFHER